jgi:hypothetical protein
MAGGHLIVAPATSDTVHPACVQIADRPLKTPAEGCVTTMSPTITPDPTETSDVLAMTFAGPDPAGAPVASGLGLASGLAPRLVHAPTAVAASARPATTNCWRGIF